jgi:hypothetical protein
MISWHVRCVAETSVRVAADFFGDDVMNLPHLRGGIS